jgi:hypothetical protein
MFAPHKPTRKTAALELASVNVERLPASLRVLVRAVGEALAYKLAHVRGGTYLDVPKQVCLDHALCHALGAADYAALVAHFGGERINIPKADALLTQQRHARVRELLAEHRSKNYIARHTGYTRRQVINIQNAGFEDRLFLQGDLFTTPNPAASATNAANAPSKTIRPALESQHTPSAHDPFGIARRNAAQARAAASSVKPQQAG